MTLDRLQVTRMRQFSAIMYKNILLQFRSRKVFLGCRLGGVAAVLFEVLIPVLFISAMCLMQRFPQLTYPPLVFKAYDLHDSQWAHTYKGALPTMPSCWQLYYPRAHTSLGLHVGQTLLGGELSRVHAPQINPA
jgi:hypothetical protein